MNKVNLNAISENVSTQYGDLTGVIQIDTHSLTSDLYDLCEDYQFDTNSLFIVGFELNEHTINGIGMKDSVSCSILYVDKEKYGNTFDEVEKKIKLDKSIKLKRKTLYIKYSTLGKYIKRYHFMATSALTASVETIEFDDNEG